MAPTAANRAAKEILYFNKVKKQNKNKLKKGNKIMNKE